MADRLGFGVIGVNPRIRRAILAGIAASRDCRLAAVCSRDAARAAAAVGEFGGKPYTSYDALLADPTVDAVFIATPHALHAPMALSALAAGKPVVCEKPLALTRAQAEELAGAAARAGLPTLVNFTYHSLPGQRFIARLLSRGEIGTLRHLDLTYWQAREALPGSQRGDALLDVGTHELDLAIWWTEAGGAGDLRTVASQEDRRDGVEDGWVPIWTALGQTSHGALVSIQANRVAAGWRNGMIARLVGDLGTISLDFDTDATDVRVARFGDGGAEGRARPRPIPADLAVSYADFPAFHLDRLAAALRGEESFPDFQYGLRVQRLIDATQRAARERRWIDLE